MFNIGNVLRDGLILTGIIVVLMILAQRVNPRLFIQDYPEDIQAAVPPKTHAEERQTRWLGIPFILAMLLVLEAEQLAAGTWRGIVTIRWARTGAASATYALVVDL